MRMKFKVRTILQSPTSTLVTLEAVTGDTPENALYAKDTTNGALSFEITAPDVQKSFTENQQFYVDLTPAA